MSVNFWKVNAKTSRLRILTIIAQVTALAVPLLMITQACKASPPFFTPFVKSPASRPVIASGVAGVPTFISDPCVIKDESGYHAFSTKSPPLLVRLFGDFHREEKITHYLSKEGEDWTKEDLILERGPQGSFDGWGIMAPTVVFEKDHVVLFYTAWEYEDRSDLPESALRRFGMGRKNGDAIHGTLGRAVARLEPEGP